MVNTGVARGVGVRKVPRSLSVVSAAVMLEQDNAGYWYFLMVRCDLEQFAATSTPISYDLTLRNPGKCPGGAMQTTTINAISDCPSPLPGLFFQVEFSADQRGIYETGAILTLALIVIVSVSCVCACGTRRRELPGKTSCAGCELWQTVWLTNCDVCCGSLACTTCVLHLRRRLAAVYWGSSRHHAAL